MHPTNQRPGKSDKLSQGTYNQTSYPRVQWGNTLNKRGRISESSNPGAKNKAADCLSRLVKPITTPVNLVTASSTDGPAFHTRSHTQNTSSSTTSTPHPDTAPQISQKPTTAPKPLTADCLEALL